jgi:penicillin-binding protein 1A
MRPKFVSSIREKDPGFLKRLWLPSALLLALMAGALTGVLASYYLNNSRYALEVTALATYRPPQVTTILADDGKTVLAQFALEKRIPIKESEIPVVVEDALLAIEDMRFFDHYGVDPYRIVGVVVRNITTGRLEGASTITQQLAKNLFLYKDQTYTRKVNEWMVALQIERFYTKRQILEMYMNYVFLGAGSYGFEAGSRTYFGKPLKDLSIEQAALLAAIPKSPEYSPTRNSRKALERRNLVLDMMGKNFPDKYSETVIESAKSKPIELAPSAYSHSLPRATAWDYPVEEIRKYLEDKYTTRVAQGGLRVYSTINIEAQRVATRTVRERLREYDRSRGKWRSDYRDILVDEAGSKITDSEDVARRLRNFRHPDWYADEFAEKSSTGEEKDSSRLDSYLAGLVMKVDKSRNQATVRFGGYTATVDASAMGRSGKQPKDEFRPGLVCEFRVIERDTAKKTLKVELTQVPEIQASILSLNAKTGEVVAMVGGYDFHWSKFNNATQGLRQTGSAYKPFIYAAAVENGWTPEMVVSGAPIKRGSWSPKNYDGSLSHGNVPMRVALAKSYNVAAVHLLEKVGVQTGAQMVRRFGITNPMSPNLASALGASEASLLEMVAAYSAFPNRGIRMQPHLIKKVENRDGSILEEWDGKSSKVMDPYTALTMVSMMRDVTSGMGTAGGANAAGHQLAGKTGTVNDHTDVWFIGYTPTYVTGVWMGNPTRKTSLGAGMTGGGGALPYFNSFMSQFMKDKKIDSFPKVPEMPADIKRENSLRRRDVLSAMSDGEDEEVGVDGELTTGEEVPGSSDSTKPPDLPIAQPLPKRND